jgi:hypothetical protein
MVGMAGGKMKPVDVRMLFRDGVEMVVPWATLKAIEMIDHIFPGSEGVRVRQCVGGEWSDWERCGSDPLWDKKKYQSTT